MSKSECVAMARDLNHHANSARRIGDIFKAAELRARRNGYILRAREA